MCLECPVTHWPDATFTKCINIKPSYIDYDSLVYILSVTGPSFGLVLSGVSAAGLVYYSKHALIKSSSRGLSSINIVGLAFSCIVLFIILARPSTVPCIMVDVSITTCVCITPPRVTESQSHLENFQRDKWKTSSLYRPQTAGGNCNIDNRIAVKTLPFAFSMFFHVLLFTNYFLTL